VSSSDAASSGSGFYVGGSVGVLGGSVSWSGPSNVGLPGKPIDLFHRYDLVDGSGSHLGGFNAGYDHRASSGIVLGAVTEIAFGAEPPSGDSSFVDGLELFASLRGRVGFGPRRWFGYGTGGIAWARDRFNVAAAPDNPLPAATSAVSQRVGWTVGAGIERALDARWIANAEYLFTRFDGTDAAAIPGTRFSSSLSLNQLRIGLHYALSNETASEAEASAVAPLDAEGWNVHGQTTFLLQYAAPFHVPYHGANSLDPNIGRETWDVTFYLGRALWKGAALWINPEIDQGYGLSNTLGVAGFTSGEAYKVGYTHPYVRIPRAFLQQTFNLGGNAETVEAGPNQFRGSRTANRLVATVGKFSVSDLFDTIVYAHDPRSDFMNWALVDAGTFDYAADAWGFTYGAALEWYQGRWVARAGLFDLSLVPNSADLDSSVRQFQLVSELEHQHVMRGQSGKIALVAFLSRGRMGTYSDALALAERTDAVPDSANVRRYNTRPGVNLNVAQQITSAMGAFARFGWADGRVEAYEFTDIDRTVSAGVSVDGRRWKRSGDTIGIAAVVNGITDVHQAYLGAGGLGILVGDGRLPHPGIESIVESYYRLAIGFWQLTTDYQLVVNPAFNRDRGPASVVALRVRTAF